MQRIGAEYLVAVTHRRHGNFANHGILARAGDTTTMPSPTNRKQSQNASLLAHDSPRYAAIVRCDMSPI
jgi:hypothetical protein